MNPKLLLCLALVLSSHCFAAIIYPQAPDGGRQMVYAFASNSLQHVPSFLGRMRIDDLTIADPFQSCTVDASNLIAGKLVAVAKPGSAGGWQYLLVHGTNGVGIAYLKADAKSGKALKCVELDPVRVSSGILEAMRIAEQLPQVKNQDYELRSLKMPWYFFRAIWLHGKSDDIFIPLPDNWNRWKAYQPCSESEIIKILKPIAQDKEKMPPGLPD
jgi:hypothetical protein